MFRSVLLALLIAVPAFAADEFILADVAKAKLNHSKEMARIRQQLLEDIDRIIKQTNDVGGGIDYMLRERKGFVENGTTPILPKLRASSENYLEAKAAIDLTLEASYVSAIDRSVKVGKLEQAINLKAELKKLRESRQGTSESPTEIQKPATTPTPKSKPIDNKPDSTPSVPASPKDLSKEPSPENLVKDDKVEKEFNRAKFNLTASAKSASTLLLEAFEQAKLNVAGAKNLSDAGKLAYMDALAKEREAFEKEGTRPRNPALQAAANRFEVTMNKARVEFSKTVNEAAKTYLDQKDLANYEALLRKKHRFLDRPTAIDLLAVIEDSKDKLPENYKIRNGVLTGHHQIEIPFEPGPEYDLHIALQRLTSDDYIAIGLVASEHICYAVFDGWPAAGCRSGLQYISGKLLIHNGTEKVGRCIPLKSLVEIDISVRKDSIRAWVRIKDDKERQLIFTYTGPQDRLHIGGEHGVKNKKGLFLITMDSTIAISEYDYVPIGPDKGRPSR